MNNNHPEVFQDWLLHLQQQICSTLEQQEPDARFQTTSWQRPEGGGGESRLLRDGELFEQAGVNISIIEGDSLPASASAARPQLEGRSFRAMGLSLVLHPRNPFIPTTHMNVRLFHAEAAGKEPIWWFGGGYDLTPYYPFLEDAQHWHRNARTALERHGADYYPRFKEWCDRYFFLPHRDETRGVGGIFFDDLDDGGFSDAMSITQSVGDSFLDGYLPILEEWVVGGQVVAASKPPDRFLAGGFRVKQTDIHVSGGNEWIARMENQ